MKQLGKCPLALLPISGPPGLPSGSSMNPSISLPWSVSIFPAAGRFSTVSQKAGFGKCATSERRKEQRLLASVRAPETNNYSLSSVSHHALFRPRRKLQLKLWGIVCLFSWSMSGLRGHYGSSCQVLSGYLFVHFGPQRTLQTAAVGYCLDLLYQFFRPQGTL